MQFAKNLVLLIVIGSFSLTGCRNDSASAPPKLLVDPLPSWTDGATKAAILKFVKEAADSSSKGFIPPADRIATFDNDGTLWAEKPIVQELFAFYRVRKMVAANPALARRQPFKAVLENDKSYFAKGGEKALIELVVATHTGMSEDEFERSVRDFFSTATYPGRNVSLRQIVYEPQVELLDYLRANGFSTFICTGGTVELVRGISWSFYGIPKEQVIGTSFRYKFVDSTRSLMRESALDHFNDKDGKPVGIQLHIGKRPVLACGNEGGEGDIAMLKFCQSNRYPSLQLIVNHDDSVREFFYQEKDSASLRAAAANNWQVISMKTDWKIIYSTK